MDILAVISRHDERVIFREDVAVVIDAPSLAPDFVWESVSISFVQIAVPGFKSSLVEDVVRSGTAIGSLSFHNVRPTR